MGWGIIGDAVDKAGDIVEAGVDKALNGAVMQGSSSFTSCEFCGRFVLDVPGLTGFVAVYRSMVAWWLDRPRIFSGYFHFRCLRSFPEREAFHREAEDLFTTGEAVIKLCLDGELYRFDRPGLDYEDKIFSGVSADVWWSRRSNGWLVLEHDGPWFFLNERNLGELRRGGPALIEPAAHVVRLPFDWDPEPTGPISLVALLERADVMDLYDDDLLKNENGYMFLEYDPVKRILEYGISGMLPVPEEAVEFLKGYEPPPWRIEDC